MRLNHKFLYTDLDALIYWLISFNLLYFIKDFGDYSLGDTPLPIPNREVKTQNADGTACAGAWESR